MNLKEILSNIPSGTQLTKVIAVDLGQKEGDWTCTVHGLRQDNGDLIIIGTEFERRSPATIKEILEPHLEELKKMGEDTFRKESNPTITYGGKTYEGVEGAEGFLVRESPEDIDKASGTHNPDAHVEEHTKNLGPCDESDYYPHEQPSSSLNKERGLGKKYPKKHRTYDHRD
jgi:hypothetical protein